MLNRYPYINSTEYEMNFLSIELELMTNELLCRIGVKWFLYTIKFLHTSLKCTTSQKNSAPTKNIFICTAFCYFSLCHLFSY